MSKFFITTLYCLLLPFVQLGAWESFCGYVKTNAVPRDIREINQRLCNACCAIIDENKKPCNKVIAVFSCQKTGKNVSLRRCFLSRTCSSDKLTTEFNKVKYMLYSNVRTAEEMIQHAGKFFALRCDEENNNDFKQRCGEWSDWEDLKQATGNDVKKIAEIAPLGTKINHTHIKDLKGAVNDLEVQYNYLKGHHWHSEQQLIEHLTLPAADNQNTTRLETVIDDFKFPSNEKTTKLLTLHIHTSIPTCIRCGPSLVNAKAALNNILNEKKLNARIDQIVVSFDQYELPKLNSQSNIIKKQKLNNEIKYYAWDDVKPPYMPMFKLEPEKVDEKIEKIENKEEKIEKIENKKEK